MRRTARTAARKHRGHRLIGLVALSCLAATTMACGDDDGGSAAEAGSGSDESSEEQPNEEELSLRVALSSADPLYAQVWATENAGLFDDENLDVSIALVGSGMSASVVSGDADLALQGLTGALTVAEQGQDTKVLYGNVGGGSAGWMVAREGIDEVEDCGEVASLSPGSSVYAWAEVYKEAFGASWENIALNDPAAGVAGVAAGQYDCAVTAYSVLSSALEDGKVHVIVDPRDAESWPEELQEGSTIIEGSIWGIEENIQEKREAIVRFFRAYQKGLELIRDSSSQELSDLLRESTDWESFSAETLPELLDFNSYSWAPDDGMISEDAWPTQIAFSKAAGIDVDEAEPQWSYESRVDMSYLEEAQG